MENSSFVADYDYQAQNEGELTYSAGEVIRIIKENQGWLFGQKPSGESGWFAPSYGHIRIDSPYETLSDTIKMEKRQLLMENIIATENEFVTMLYDFIQAVITPINLRDTPFKRSFLGDSSVAVSFSLLQDMYKACYNFETVVRATKTDLELANAYIQFAPSMQIFAQYASENAKLLNSIKSSRQLSDIVPDRINLIQTLIHPMQHCSVYKSFFQEYVWLTPVSTPDVASLSAALDMIIAQSNYVEAKLREEEESWQLLNLQEKCMSFCMSFFRLITIA
jgi:hypothetical protein